MGTMWTQGDRACGGDDDQALGRNSTAYTTTNPPSEHTNTRHLVNAELSAASGRRATELAEVTTTTRWDATALHATNESIAVGPRTSETTTAGRAYNMQHCIGLPGEDSPCQRVA